ncbi:MAG TPA: hypothetical protein VGN34_33230, partial [Ktedonobacteraceae bacterium]
HLSPGQKSFLLGARRGEGLFATKSWSQMEVLASPMEAKMANTTLASTLTQAQQAAIDLERNYNQALPGRARGVRVPAETVAANEHRANQTKQLRGV